MFIRMPKKDLFVFYQINIIVQSGRGRGYCLKRITWMDGIARFLFVPAFLAFVALFINQSELVVPNENVEKMSSFIPYIEKS